MTITELLAHPFVAGLMVAGNAQQGALRSLPCRCSHNVPYAGGQVERKATIECARCVSMRLWDETKIKTPSA
jgi:hypothetical protein